MASKPEVRKARLTSLRAVASLWLPVSDPDEIYRKAALDHYLAGHEFGAVTRVSPPWTWALLLISLTAAGAALFLSIFTRIEIVDRTPGVLRRNGPDSADYEAVTFLPARHRSFLQRNDLVKLELAEFPYAEFGTVRGRIERIVDAPASPEEIRAALGADARPAGPVHRMEISVLPEPSSAKASIALRTGMPADVRYTVRRERPVFILVAPLRRWLNG